MTTAEALEKISKALGVLAYQTRAENIGGLFSKNRIAEDILLPVLRIALASPDLRNLNQGKVNFPYIDLADDSSRLAIQVTVERDADKVSETLTGFIDQRYHERYRRLVVFVLTAEKLNYRSTSRKKWKTICGDTLEFDPGSDILTNLDLFALIQRLPHAEILAIQDLLSQSIIGEHYLDVEEHLSKQAAHQLELEKKWGKYIPDIFVESRETKSLARSFAHPVLCFRRTVESMSRLNLAWFNRVCARAGLPGLPLLQLDPFHGALGLTEVSVAADRLRSDADKLKTASVKYHSLSRSDPPPFAIAKGHQAFYEQNTYTLESGSRGVAYHLDERLDELGAVRARVFILTGRAGQGKTNFVCDFVENFLWKHAIPCAYVSARRLGVAHPSDVGEAIHRLIFEGKTVSFAQAAAILSAHAERLGKPFVLIIDGLNEHHRISEFAQQLETFAEAFIGHPNLKLLLTCRSEFFQQRFGNLTKGPIGESTFVVETNDRRFDEERYDELLNGYFKFFEIDRRLVSEQVIESLSKDILLLRFFCEAYGARGKSEGYRQPQIRNIYREQIFEIYLKEKLGTANAFLQRVTGRMKPVNSKGDLEAVLGHVIEHMLKTWQFSDVPATAVPPELQDELFALLDEELILRRDAAAPSGGVFATAPDTLNFTFDEFRDFLLAQYLVRRVFANDRTLFQQYIAKNDPKDSQVVEGMKKFLFYASRHTENEDFWNYYREQPWYKDVYDRELFNIDVKLLRAEDKAIAVAALEGGDERAREFARRLGLCWYAPNHPLLNLDVLLSFIGQSDDSYFDNAIAAAFRPNPYGSGHVSTREFCEFISEKVLPDFDPAVDSAETSLFRFLILLLPVDSGADLNSGSDLVYRELLRRYPAYGIELLTQSLNLKPTRHLPYVWRLLAVVAAQIEPSDPLIVEARQQLAQTHHDPVLHREISRFLDRVLGAAAPSAS